MKKEILHYRAKIAGNKCVQWSRERRKMQQGDSEIRSRGMLGSVLTDVQFWIPLAVLIGGLILLSAIH
jgi:hypothetical protein